MTKGRRLLRRIAIYGAYYLLCCALFSGLHVLEGWPHHFRDVWDIALIPWACGLFSHWMKPTRQKPVP